MDVQAWITAVERDLLPRLPGDWVLAGDALARAPVGWTAQRVAPQPSDDGSGFYLLATVQLLALPSADTYRCGRRLGYWSGGFEEVMPEIADRVTGEAVPFFDRYGPVEGYLGHLRERMAALPPGREWVDIGIDEELAYASLILGDRAGAEAAAGYAERAAAEDPVGWAQEAAARVQAVMAAEPDVALAILKGQARSTAEELWLPEPAL